MCHPGKLEMLGLRRVQTRKLSRYISDKPNQVVDYTL